MTNGGVYLERGADPYFGECEFCAYYHRTTPQSTVSFPMSIPSRIVSCIDGKGVHVLVLFTEGYVKKDK